ncbi:MAG: hypothetical protein ACO3KE_08100, partial [Ilumatobacteraceae bacterium]
MPLGTDLTTDHVRTQGKPATVAGHRGWIHHDAGTEQMDPPAQIEFLAEEGNVRCESTDVAK